jgi:hypothetical protein
MIRANPLNMRAEELKLLAKVMEGVSSFIVCNIEFTRDQIERHKHFSPLMSKACVSWGKLSSSAREAWWGLHNLKGAVDHKRPPK